MDVDEISKIAIGNRTIENAAVLREKISKENRKIISLHVDQEASYWNLKQELQQLQQNYEKLQENMWKLQMEHEALSTKYQNELRLRPEILNKVASLNAFWQAMQQYTTRINDFYTEIKSDYAIVSKTYEDASQNYNDLWDQFLQFRAKGEEQASQYAVMVELVVTSARNDVRAQMNKENDLLKEKNFQLRQIIVNKDATIENLNEKIKSLEIKNLEIQKNYDFATVEANNRIEQMYQELRCHEDKISHIEEEYRNYRLKSERVSADAETTKEHLTSEMQGALKTIAQLTENLSMLNENNEKTIETIAEKNQEIENRDATINDLNEKIITLEMKNTEMQTKLETAKAEEISNIEQKIQIVRARDEQLRKLNEELNNHRLEYERLSKSAEETIDSLNRALQSEAANVHKLQESIHVLRVEAANNLDQIKEQESKQRARADELEDKLKETEQENAQHINEIKQLQKRIGELEMRMNIAQKELAIETPKERGRGREQTQTEYESNKTLNTSNALVSATSRCKNIYNFFSDSSVESDVVGIVDLDRRYEEQKKRMFGERMRIGRAKLDTATPITSTPAPAPAPTPVSESVPREFSAILQPQLESTSKKRKFFKTKRGESKKNKK